MINTGIYNCDFRESSKLIKDCSVDLIITDPPYKTTKRGNSGGTGGIGKTKDFIKGNGGFKYNEIEFNEWLPECYRVLKEGSHAYFMTNNKNLKDMLTSVENAGFKIFKTIIWEKNTCITNMWYMDSHEYIIFARKGKAKKINNCGTRSVLKFDNVKNKTHPTEKPVELWEVLIKNSVETNNMDITVFDPFMGSGSSGDACYRNNVNFIGFEIDEKYFKIAKDRVYTSAENSIMSYNK